MKKKTFAFFMSLMGILFTLWVCNGRFAPTKVTAYSTTWGWPLEDANPLIETKDGFGITVENTDYAVKNLDLIQTNSDEHITCFGVGWHRPYHAGVDLYLHLEVTRQGPL